MTVIERGPLTQRGRAATKAESKGPTLTSPPSRGREERGHAIGVNGVSLNDRHRQKFAQTLKTLKHKHALNKADGNTK